MNKEDLLELKTDIEAAKVKISRLEGAKETLLEQLKTKWECKGLEEAKKKVEQLAEKNQALQKKLDEGLKELEDIMDTIDGN